MCFGARLPGIITFDYIPIGDRSAARLGHLCLHKGILDRIWRQRGDPSDEIHRN